MTTETKAMLFALTSPYPSVSLEYFNKWYDEKHAISRKNCPGVRDVSRYYLVDDAQSQKRIGDWEWLAMYELEDEAALHTEEYKKARKKDGNEESTMFDFLSRRVYQLLEDVKADDYSAVMSSGKSRLMSVVGMQVNTSEASKDQDTLGRYIRSNLSRSKGWLRSSYWRLSTASDPRTGKEQTDTPTILVLHEWEDSDVTRESGALQKVLAPTIEAFNGVETGVVERALLRLWKQI